MGLNFRKSYNIGKGFKTTVSNSGIGLSWGMKGFRISKTAKGDIKNTFSIPGTDIKYTQTISSKKGKLKIIPLIIAIVALIVIILYNNPEILQSTLKSLGIEDNSFIYSIINPLKDTANSEDTYVFVTNSGKKYHLESCQTLKTSKNKISLKQAIIEEYEACSICNPPIE